MIYALNVFNLVPGREAEYRDYSVKAGKIIYGLGGKVLGAGQGPLREMHGDTTRRQMIVVEFPALRSSSSSSTKRRTRTSTTCARIPLRTTSGRCMSRGT